MSCCQQKPVNNIPETTNCSLSTCYDLPRGNIICPPCDRKEQYEFSSERSCTDFSQLCEDKPKICCEKKDKQPISYDSDSESDSELNCGGCGRCNRCYDYSANNVAKSLLDSEPSCPDLFDLVNDKQKVCCEQKETTPKEPSKESSSKKGKRFIFTFGKKDGHAWAEYNQGTDSIYVNGKNGPVLHLYRGSTYFFCVDQKDTENTLVLTNSPVGGNGYKLIHGGFDPIAKGCVCVKIDEETPKYFYYQSSSNQFQGGLIIVHDQDK